MLPRLNCKDHFVHIHNSTAILFFSRPHFANYLRERHTTTHTWHNLILEMKIFNKIARKTSSRFIRQTLISCEEIRVLRTIYFSSNKASEKSKTIQFIHLNTHAKCSVSRPSDVSTNFEYIHDFSSQFSSSGEWIGIAFFLLIFVRGSFDFRIPKLDWTCIFNRAYKTYNFIWTIQSERCSWAMGVTEFKFCLWCKYMKSPPSKSYYYIICLHKFINKLSRLKIISPAMKKKEKEQTPTTSNLPFCWTEYLFSHCFALFCFVSRQFSQSRKKYINANVFWLHIDRVL